MEQKYSTCLLQQDSPSDDEGETLSLRDLPIYGENDYAEEDHEQIFDNFEFFSEEWSSPRSSSADNVLFCGKLIANKDYKQSLSGKRGVLQGNFNSKTSKPYVQKGICVDKYNGSSSLSYGQNFNSVSASNCMSKIGKCEDKNDTLAYEIAIFKSPTRSRWFLFFFGSAKIPAEMEIRDIRRRQLKKSMSQQSLGGASAKITSRKNRGIGWWKLIRALGCHTHHPADSVIKASHSCAPLVGE
ncbi:hypothetical protein POM88_006227 [Heracleum sosnowskyi]|uniref:Uncharacterized protein n=1 Tax=Heracleum sosnowskyi TaxID=360622 RepID=A0AAD8N4K4_9APIA|nr:hypothetical protein POM88_006227 [Heracleum sosnowskyi]